MIKVFDETKLPFLANDYLPQFKRNTIHLSVFYKKYLGEILDYASSSEAQGLTAEELDGLLKLIATYFSGSESVGYINATVDFKEGDVSISVEYSDIFG